MFKNAFCERSFNWGAKEHKNYELKKLLELISSTLLLITT